MISRGSEIELPAQSPDLNLLDFYFCALTQKGVYTDKPSAIVELIDVVEQFASESSDDVLKDLDVLERGLVSTWSSMIAKLVKMS